MNRLQPQEVILRRHGSYEEPFQSRRQATFSYLVPNDADENVQVCSKTFREIFALISRKLQILQEKKKAGIFVFKDGHGKTLNLMNIIANLLQLITIWYVIISTVFPGMRATMPERGVTVNICH